MASPCRIFIVITVLKKSERVGVSQGCSPKQPASVWDHSPEAVQGSDLGQRVACRLSLTPNQALPKPGCILVFRQHLLQEPSLSKSKLLGTRKAFKESLAPALFLVPQEGRSHKGPGVSAQHLDRCRMALAPAWTHLDSAVEVGSVSPVSSSLTMGWFLCSGWRGCLGCLPHWS